LFVLLDDAELRDYNFSKIRDPDLLAGHGPKETDLYRLVHESRHARRLSGTEFANAMYWTLRPATFEAFQRKHGPRPIEYRDWFYSKLYQFLSILVYEAVEVYGLGPEAGLETLHADDPWKQGCRVFRGEGPLIDAEELEASFTPGDNESEEGYWGEIVGKLAGAGENRFAVLQEWMREMRERRSAEPRRRRSWAKNQERDQVILSCLARGMERGRFVKNLTEG
jgi:hypothetical protein